MAFDDFACNGLLLPATEERAVEFGMPLHRGPHRVYSEMVAERVGRIEAEWSRHRLQAPSRCAADALFRLALLQGALRRRLLAERRRMVLNRNDPLGTGYDFDDLDALAERLWSATGP